MGAGLDDTGTKLETPERRRYVQGLSRVRPSSQVVMRSDVVPLECIKRCFAPVLAAGGAKRAILFGSYARGEADEYSDVDLVIIKETGLPFLDRDTDFQGLFEATRKALQILVYTPDEFERMRAGGNPFILNVIKDGVVIYEA